MVSAAMYVKMSGARRPLSSEPPMRHLLSVLSVLMCSMLLPVSSFAADRAREVLDEAAADGRVAGVVAMVATADEVLFSHASGYANVARQEPMRLDSLFGIASMTKAVTSVALMQLVERGAVDLDAPMSDYLDAFYGRPVLLDIDSGEPRYSSATYTPTVRQLLSHTSGFAYSVWNEKLFAIADFENFSPTSFMEEPLVFPPGEQWHYSISTDWAGLIVEQVTGKTLEAYFASEIFAPLEMTTTAYNIDADARSRLATIYRRKEDGSLEASPRPDFVPQQFFSGGSGLQSTAGDYLRFLQMLLRGGAW